MACVPKRAKRRRWCRAWRANSACRTQSSPGGESKRRAEVCRSALVRHATTSWPHIAMRTTSPRSSPRITSTISPKPSLCGSSAAAGSTGLPPFRKRARGRASPCCVLCSTCRRRVLPRRWPPPAFPGRKIQATAMSASSGRGREPIETHSPSSVSRRRRLRARHGGSGARVRRSIGRRRTFSPGTAT